MINTRILNRAVIPAYTLKLNSCRNSFAKLPHDLIALKMSFLTADTMETIAIASLPDEVLAKIISFFPKFPRMATAHNLNQVYELLSLARLHPGCAHLFTQHTSAVKYIDPFPGIPHSEPSAHLPPYAKPRFLCLLVSVCEKLYSLRAPSVRSVLGFADHHLRELSFIDDGLTPADLFFLSRSSLTIVSVTNPSEAVLSALTEIKTLKRVSLLQISPNVLSSILTFLGCTTTTCLFLDLNFPADQDLYFLLHRLPALQTFVLKCQVRHAWSILECLRMVATKIGSVYLVVDGVQIAVQKLEAAHSDNGKWEASIMQRLIRGRDLRTNQRNSVFNSVWPRGMCLKELDLELLEDGNTCQTSRDILDKHFLNYFETAPANSEITVRLGRNAPSLEQADVQCEWVMKTLATALATSLVMSQDIVRYALSNREHWQHKFWMAVMSNFTRISTLHLRKPLRGEKVSGRFVMALPDFLKTVTHRCALIESIYLEDVGELVLQTVGMPVLTDEKKMKELLHAVIARVKGMEKTCEVEMGTIIAQLEKWACSKLRVDASVVINEAML